jgi:hypothetical protein
LKFLCKLEFLRPINPKIKYSSQQNFQFSICFQIWNLPPCICTAQKPNQKFSQIRCFRICSLPTSPTILKLKFPKSPISKFTRRAEIEPCFEIPSPLQRNLQITPPFSSLLHIRPCHGSLAPASCQREHLYFSRFLASLSCSSEGKLKPKQKEKTRCLDQSPTWRYHAYVSSKHQRSRSYSSFECSNGEKVFRGREAESLETNGYEI